MARMIGLNYQIFSFELDTLNILRTPVWNIFHPKSKLKSEKRENWKNSIGKFALEKKLSPHLIFMFTLFNYANERKIHEFILIAKQKKISFDFFIFPRLWTTWSQGGVNLWLWKLKTLVISGILFLSFNYLRLAVIKH